VKITILVQGMEQVFLLPTSVSFLSSITKIMLYKIHTNLVLLYGCETWTISYV